MVLQTTRFYTTGSTGAGTEDTLGSSAFGPTGDNEIQMRLNDTIPTLIGFHTFSLDAARIGGTAASDYTKLTMNTWTNAQYYQCGPHLSTPHATSDVMGSHAPPDWWLPGIPMDRDADWDIGVMTTTAGADCGGILHLSYGARLPYRGGRIISRLVEFTTDAAVSPAVGGAEVITDLDPRVMYRVAGMQLANVENADNVSLTVTSPSNSTSVTCLAPSWADTTFHFHNQTQWLPHDSILVNGVESVNVDASAVAAHKPSAIIHFEEYGGSGVGRRPVPMRAARKPSLVRRAVGGARRGIAMG